MEEAQNRSFGERFGLAVVIPLGFFLFLMLVLLTPNFGVLFRSYHIPAASMEPNYPVGSYILINRAAYGFSAYSFDVFTLPVKGRWPDKMPVRGDVIVFKLPRDASQDYVKRVIGLPGDKIQFQEDRIYLNGAVLPQTDEGLAVMTAVIDGSRARAPLFRETFPDGTSFTHAELLGKTAFGANTEEFTVPPRHLFVAGDNRDNSNDSRMPHGQQGVGFLPVENVVGKVVLGFGNGS